MNTRLTKYLNRRAAIRAARHRRRKRYFSSEHVAAMLQTDQHPIPTNLSPGDLRETLIAPHRKGQP